MNWWIAEFLEFTLIVTGLQYLFGEARITAALRALYPPWAEILMTCPSCAGFWIGLLGAGLGLGPVTHAHGLWWGALTGGLIALVTTPALRGLMALGWAVAEPPHVHAHAMAEPAPPVDGVLPMTAEDEPT